MKITELIEKKKNGGTLTTEEIAFFVDGYVDGTIPDYQASALLMAIWFRGMDERETFDLTMAMKNSGDVLDLSSFGQTIDKHSTGGIGDKLSLIVLPLWVAGGMTVAKMSGRGLGFTGGTIDKLESIPGYDAFLDKKSFAEHVAEHRIAVTGQSTRLVPADKKLYALRDVTGTVDSLPLIAASIMSKKLATAASIIILDVKYGEGAFMKTKEDAAALAECMVKLGEKDGRAVAALLSPMDHPLGYAVGNALEVKEAYAFLRGEVHGFLEQDALALAGIGFVLGGKAATLKEGIALCRRLIRDGSGAEALLRWICAQGGVFEKDDFLSTLNYPCRKYEFLAAESGFVTAINAMEIGLAAMELGAGRKALEDTIDPAAGIVLRKAVGDKVEKGEILAVLHTNIDPAPVLCRMERAFNVKKEKISEDFPTVEIFDGKKWERLNTIEE